MSKNYYLKNKSLPKFSCKGKGIQVRNGSNVNILFAIHIIITFQGCIFKNCTMVLKYIEM